MKNSDFKEVYLIGDVFLLSTTDVITFFNPFRSPLKSDNRSTQYFKKISRRDKNRFLIQKLIDLRSYISQIL
ncbi:hypothetical protein DPV73_14890 [Leptospira mayottensis]|nr:hypothetical protein DPV73_14890 [Leptospira mayottensis]